VQAAHPANCLPSRLPEPGMRTIVIGAGKGSAMMAHELEKRWPGALEGIVVTRYGHAVPCRNIEIIEAGHPLPDENSVRAADRILKLVRGLGREDLVIALISGGGSALLCLPPEGISLAEKMAVNSDLLKSGATISEMNCVRKHISAIKGGRLAAAIAPARLVTWLISDVPGDDPAMIASGPTVADDTSVETALRIIGQYRIPLSDGLRTYLAGGQAVTPKKNNHVFDNTLTRIIASPMQSLQAAERLARQQGFTVLCLGDALEGEAREVGRVHAGVARSIARFGIPVTSPAILLSGGEVTVTLTGEDAGRGGPNQEFLLGLALELDSHIGIHALACDTDGMDGSEPVAGAIIHPDTLKRAAIHQLSIRDALKTHNSYKFFKELADTVETGPTYTNINDFRAILLK
ncbi:MAG TPA: glycerate kinase, partial [Desulfobulbaceae bacterium]|nr:glycerate kinase [Desulfobulbaceae bacterium]